MVKLCFVPGTGAIGPVRTFTEHWARPLPPDTTSTDISRTVSAGRIYSPRCVNGTAARNLFPILCVHTSSLQSAPTEAVLYIYTALNCSALKVSSTFNFNTDQSHQNFYISFPLLTAILFRWSWLIIECVWDLLNDAVGSSGYIVPKIRTSRWTEKIGKEAALP
jgi:hypothetical protein